MTTCPSRMCSRPRRVPSHLRRIEIPRKKAPKADTDDDDTDNAGSGDVMALGSTELTTYLLNKHPDRAADGMQPSHYALALSLRCNPEAHEELKVSKEALSTMKQVASTSAPRVLYVKDCPRGNADYAIIHGMARPAGDLKLRHHSH